ncbi:MAG TPA: hypothetical protein VLJ10_00890 [Candidatus Bathyarchaeia archaeon]|nr:hypothetical protein [Candidatus Bathyarchaeia archaeon]
MPEENKSDNQQEIKSLQPSDGSPSVEGSRPDAGSVAAAQSVKEEGPRKILNALDQQAAQEQKTVVQDALEPAVASVPQSVPEPSPDDLPLPPEVREQPAVPEDSSGSVVPSDRVSSPALLSAGTGSMMDPDCMISEAMRRLDAMLAQIKESQANLPIENSRVEGAPPSGNSVKAEESSEKSG